MLKKIFWLIYLIKIFVPIWHTIRKRKFFIERNRVVFQIDFGVSFFEMY
jgi:hypothetical protein